VQWRDFTVRISEQEAFEGNVLVDTVQAILNEEKNTPSLATLQENLLANRKRFAWTLDSNHSAGGGDSFYHVGEELKMHALKLRNGRGS